MPPPPDNGGSSGGIITGGDGDDDGSSGNRGGTQGEFDREDQQEQGNDQTGETPPAPPAPPNVTPPQESAAPEHTASSAFCSGDCKEHNPSDLPAAGQPQELSAQTTTGEPEPLIKNETQDVGAPTDESEPSQVVSLVEASDSEGGEDAPESLEAPHQHTDGDRGGLAVVSTIAVCTLMGAALVLCQHIWRRRKS